SSTTGAGSVADASILEQANRKKEHKRHKNVVLCLLCPFLYILCSCPLLLPQLRRFRCTKKFICSLKNDAAEANWVVSLGSQEFTHCVGGSARIVPAQRRIHPSCRKENVTCALNVN